MDKGQGKEHTYIQAYEMMLQFRSIKLPVHLEELFHCGFQALGHDNRGWFHFEKPAGGYIHTHTSNVIHVGMRDEQEILRHGTFRTTADIKGKLEVGEQDARLLTADGNAFNGEAVELQRPSFRAAELELGGVGRSGRRGGGRGHSEAGNEGPGSQGEAIEGGAGAGAGARARALAQGTVGEEGNSSKGVSERAAEQGPRQAREGQHEAWLRLACLARPPARRSVRGCPTVEWTGEKQARGLRRTSVAATQGDVVTTLEL